MARTVICKDINGNFVYPKTLIPNVRGLVTELETIKEAIGMENPHIIPVLWVSDQAAPPSTDPSVYEGLKIGDLYICTPSNHPPKIYFCYILNGAGTRCEWKEIAVTDDIADEVRSILSTDTTVGASLAQNTGLISGLTQSSLFQQNLFSYWFSSPNYLSADNILSWLLSNGAADYQGAYWNGIFNNFSSIFVPVINSCFPLFNRSDNDIQTFFANVINYNGSQFGGYNNRTLFSGIIAGLYTLSSSDNKSNLYYLLSTRYREVDTITSMRNYIISPTVWYYNLLPSVDKIVADITFDCFSSGMVSFSPFSNQTTGVTMATGASNMTAKVVIDPIASIVSFALMRGNYMVSSTEWHPNKTIGSYAYMQITCNNIISSTLRGSVYLKI